MFVLYVSFCMFVLYNVLGHCFLQPGQHTVLAQCPLEILIVSCLLGFPCFLCFRSSFTWLAFRYVFWGGAVLALDFRIGT